MACPALCDRTIADAIRSCSSSGRTEWMDPLFSLSQDTASNSTTCPSNISTSREHSLHRTSSRHSLLQRQYLASHARLLHKFLASNRPASPFRPPAARRLPSPPARYQRPEPTAFAFDVVRTVDRLLATNASKLSPPNVSTSPDGLLNPCVLNFHLGNRATERQCETKRRSEAVSRTLDFFEPPRTQQTEGLGLPRETHKLHHMILTWSGQADLVKVCGSFSPTPWVDTYPLWWCSTNRVHWIDLHETVVPDLCGIIQFKFIVDGVWKCDPAYPICDDGSVNHNLNNVSVIFPHRLRLRLSFEKLRKRQSLCPTREAPTGQSSSFSTHDPDQLFIPLLNTDQGLVNQPTWACRPSSPSASTTPATLSFHRAALKSRWRLASETRNGAPAEAEKRQCPSSDSDSAKAVVHPPLISGQGPNCSRACRGCMRNVPRDRRKRVASNDGLLRCLSHHGGRLNEAAPTPAAFHGASRLFEWPSNVTKFLHSPDVLLALRLPSNVLKMRGENLKMAAGWAMTPHPEKVASGGADAFYVSQKEDCLALADGVGEWDSLGFCPRAFADDLMTGIAEIWEDMEHPIHQLRGRLPPSLIAQELMKLASKKPKTYGSATCCIAIFDKERQQLGVCNLGDSGCCILRRNDKCQMSCRFKTEVLTHFFNCPYQLSLSPPSGVLTRIFGVSKVENGKGLLLPSEDEPKHAKLYDVSIEEGDLVLLASDGLWDNLWPSEISSVAQLALAPLESLILHDSSLSTGPDQIARAVTEAAAYRSRDRRCCTPFAKSYTDECGVPAFAGGKWDDITVVAAWVTRQEKSCHADPTTANSMYDEGIPPGLGRWPYRPHSSNNLAAADSDCDLFDPEKHGHRKPRKRLSNQRRPTDAS